MTHDVAVHVHDPDPPQGTGCVCGKEKWGAQEWIRVKHLIGRGHDVASIALMIGRSREQVKGKIRWENMSAEKRQARRDRINARRNESGEYRSTPRPDKPTITHRAPPEALAERAMRLSAPQTLTGAFCGDPPIGFSALDRKLSGKAEEPYIDHSLAQLQRKPSLVPVPA
ncbi:hypothetical protein GWE18_00245 [Bradyrhizobium sp. CSA112]|uniref:hypothetical protein n=1 Tax=Bradyrhizobium sp. CSA112 TaxID=2699170 RepID=UPI0023B1E019|nr:hypothetical protein [Bradyrhizobium sp. CSA112]MDE5451306.1 hypothetical protein [Bradyrhizobium sp. CSA112]